MMKIDPDVFATCSALTVKGRPCKNRGTVPVPAANGREAFLCVAHAKAILNGSEAAPKTPKKSPRRPVEVKPDVTPAPGPKWAAAEPSGPFSAKTIRKQIERIERRDRKRAERKRPLNAPSRYARPLALVAVSGRMEWLFSDGRTYLYTTPPGPWLSEATP